MNKSIIGAAAACFVLSALPAALPAHADQATGLLQKWSADNEHCRGGSGDDPRTWKFCALRDKDDKKLKALGWCYGEPGQAGYQMEWHKCAGKTADGDYQFDRSQYKNVGDLSQYSNLVITPKDVGHKIEAIGELQVFDGIAELSWAGKNPWIIIKVEYKQLPQSMVDELRRECPSDIRCVGRWDITLIGEAGEDINRHEVVRLDGWEPLNSAPR